jgi:hypothetical protein
MKFWRVRGVARLMMVLREVEEPRSPLRSVAMEL